MTTKEMATKTIQTEVPIGLLTQAEDLVEAGWFRNLTISSWMHCAAFSNPIVVN